MIGAQFVMCLNLLTFLWGKAGKGLNFSANHMQRSLHRYNLSNNQEPCSLVAWVL